MIGLLDYDFCCAHSSSILLPNLEIMKLATYYRTEENKFCKLLSLEELELNHFEKIYFFSESHENPQIPPAYLRAKQVIYGGTAFTNGVYVPFENELIDFTLPKVNIYKESLQKKYDDGVKAKVIRSMLDSTYYRCYSTEKLPLPPILPNKKVIIYDREFFYPNWREILKEIREKNPSSIYYIHPIICHTLSNFFEVRNFSKLNKTNTYILDLDIPLTEAHYMLDKYRNYLLAEIVPNSTIFLPLGGTFKTNFQYFKDFIYKINLLYCFWSHQIPIKLYFEPPFIGYSNPLLDLSRRTANWSNLTRKHNSSITLNQRITHKKPTIEEEQKNLLLKFYPSAGDLFNQCYEKIIKGGRWRI